MRNWSDFYPKNPKKTLKFASKTKLNAMRERSLWGVGVAVGMVVGGRVLVERDIFEKEI